MDVNAPKGREIPWIFSNHWIFPDVVASTMEFNGTSPIQQLLRCDSSAPVSPKVLVVLKCHSNHVWQNAGTPIMDSQSVHPCDTSVLLKPLNTFVSKTSAEEFLVVPFCSILKKVYLKSMPK